MGQELLKDSNAHALYYGRFITKFNDQSICGPCFTPYIEVPNVTQPIDEESIDKELMDACEHYDKEVIANKPPQKKQKIAKVNDTNIKKSRKGKKNKEDN